MTTPEHEPRAAWLAAARAILGAVEAHPGLPLPYISAGYASFYIVTVGPQAPKALADAETALASALGVTFTPEPEPDESGLYVLTATLPGALTLAIRTPAASVAERRVTGTTVTEVTEWVRLPAEPEEGEAAE